MHLKKRRCPKKKANLSPDILALYIGTNSEVECSPAHLEPQLINELSDIRKLLETKVSLLPQELIDVYNLQTEQRPLLYLIET